MSTPDEQASQSITHGGCFQHLPLSVKIENTGENLIKHHKMLFPVSFALSIIAFALMVIEDIKIR
jgi:hypothetical protein